MIQREHSFQAWVDRFLDRVVLPPMFTSAIDVAARDMASIGRRSALQGRGLKFGIPDVFVAQHRAWDLACWLELKRGAPVTAQQEATHNAMRRAGQRISVCSTVREVLIALRHFGFELHENADALALEYEIRVDTGEQAPRTPKPPAKPRARRATQGQIASWHAAGGWRP